MRLHNAESGRRRHSGPPMAEINIIPLVDVVLVLLIIFMATTAFVKEAGINMKLPAAQTSDAAAEISTDINVALTRDNGIYLDGKPSTEPAVQAAMIQRAAKNPETRVILKGDEKIEYRRVMRVIDMARQAGLPKVALATEQPEAPPAGSAGTPVSRTTPRSGS